MLIAQKVEPPPSLVQQMANALLIECWRIGNVAAVLTRENVETLENTPNYRWHLSLAHPERKPTQREFEIGVDLLPDGGNFMVEVSFGEAQIDIWEVEDEPLARKRHLDQEASEQA